MPEWLIAPFMGVFGLVVSFSVPLDEAFGRRARLVLRRFSAVVVLVGFLFARDAVFEFFMERGRDASDLITEIIQDSLDVNAPTVTPTTAP